MMEDVDEEQPGLIRRLWGNSAVRYLVVGGACFLADVALLWFAKDVLHIPLAIATPIAFLASFAITYTLQRVFAFNADNAVAPSVVRYSVLVAVNTLATTGIVWLCDEIGWGWLIGKIIAVAITTVSNYFIYRHWVFAPGKEQTERV